MESTTINSFVNDLSQNGEILKSYFGEMTKPVLMSTLEEVETQLKNDGEHPKISRKVYNVLVEALQNLYHHTDGQTEEALDNGDTKKTAAFYLGRKDGEYNILVANYLIKDSIPPLKSKLDTINDLDSDGLRAHYKEVLNNGQYSIHGGGGLGMIDIARKSKNKLNYEFANVNSDYSLFILKIKI